VPESEPTATKRYLPGQIFNDSSLLEEEKADSSFVTGSEIVECFTLSRETLLRICGSQDEVKRYIRT
jgi:CRP-like cAMP-binding protein